uniref:Uncharacterized protein n=1 Tax=Ditylenchus dipsaci TaxID=166011 RepID=A0A915DVM5_9BILA
MFCRSKIMVFLDRDDTSMCSLVSNFPPSLTNFLTAMLDRVGDLHLKIRQTGSTSSITQYITYSMALIGTKETMSAEGTTIVVDAWQSQADPSLGGAQDQVNKPVPQQQNAPPPVQQQQQMLNKLCHSLHNSHKLPRRTMTTQRVWHKGRVPAASGEVLNDMAALDSCFAQAVWEYKIQITQDTRFIGAIKQFCAPEIEKNPKIKECTLDERPGYALSCMMDHAHEIEQSSQCFQFLVRTERVAFSDFRLIAPFVEHCANLIMDLGCGTLTKPSKHQGVRVPHSQGSTLECLIEKLVNVPKDPVKQKLVQGISKECRHEVMRIAELQSDDFHLDRPLYFACRKDREVAFCHDLAAGEGKVFQCLVSHKDDKEMEPECSKILSERAGLMGQDYRLSHPLTKACGQEMEAYKCKPQPGFEKSLQFHLSWVLLCLENGLHHFQQQLYDKQQAEKEGKSLKKCQTYFPTPMNASMR